MAIEYVSGNLLAANVEAIVNTVNTVGVMGKGIALQVKLAYPEAFQVYTRACRAHKVQIGQMHVVYRSYLPYYIINFPTKEHWRNPAKLEYIQRGLENLVICASDLGISSLAIPPLGCGCGGLSWNAVKPLIENIFVQLPNIKVLLYEPY